MIGQDKQELLIQEPVKASIQFCLNNNALNDAIFLSERLYSEVGSEEALHLLANCYYRSGKTWAAYSILTREQVSTPKCRLLLARCCLELKKFSEAEETILSKFPQFESKSVAKVVVSCVELVQVFGETASIVAQLLGQIYAKTERVPKAIDYFSKSLQLNPFLWTSFESLVQLGHDVDPDKIFDASHADLSLCHGCHPLIRMYQTSGGSVLPTRTPQTTVQTKEGSNKKFDINSPFAVIKPGTDFETIDMCTPVDSIILPSYPLAPQKQPTGIKSTKKVCLAAVNLTGQLDQQSETPPNRASFGVFPVGDQQSKLTFKTPSNQVDEDEKKQVENIATRAPRRDVKRNMSTRRGHHYSVSSNTTSTRSTVHRGQIFSQDGNNKPPTNNNSFCGTEGLRRSTRLTSHFSSLSSVKENAKSRNQENKNKSSISNYNNDKTTPPKNKRKYPTSTVTAAEMKAESDSSEADLKARKPSSLTPEDLFQAAIQMQRTSAEGLMNLLKHLGKGQQLLGQYKTTEAIHVLKTLPEKHLKSGWVLTSLARCYFEQSQYSEAVKYYEQAREREPHRLQGCEYYSTALWHLQREVKLSMLSQELIEQDKDAPQTWCAAGNCFSLQKEHETAIKFLQKAIQVDADFAYAYTLLGHELVLTEEMDHAAACFRSAIRIDPRHYNGWCGLAMICYKQEKYDLAEVHYKQAVEICPSSPTLRCHLGVVMHAQKKTDQALTILSESIRMDPKVPLSRFHRASIYFSVDRHEEALQELEALKILAPKESLVHFLIGKVHKRLGNTHLALKSFSWAMDLDPKGANNQIKEVIDRQYAKEDDEEDVPADAESSRQDKNPEEDEEAMDAEEQILGHEVNLEVTF